MLKTIVALFAIYESSLANRLLLQNIIPTATTAAPGGGFSVIPGGNGGGGFSIPPPPPRELDCAYECTSTAPPLEVNCPSPCALQTKTIANPIQNFKVKCSAPGACAQSTFVLDYLPGSGTTERIEGFWFSESYAAYGLTIKIQNNQGSPLLLDQMKCTKYASCEQLTIILGDNVSVNDVDCYPGACNNCVFKYHEADPGIPCYSVSNQFAPAPATPAAV